jgi:hypothetical protein
MKSVGEERFEQESKIILTIPSFTVFITGNLAYYADALGMPSSSSYWCPWCLLSHPEWQLLPSNQPAEECTSEFLENMYQAILKDERKELKPMKKIGVPCAIHYKSFTPKSFVPPLLHLEMRMVNQIWDDFEQWIDGIEMIPPHEQDACKNVSNSNEMLEIATIGKKMKEKKPLLTFGKRTQKLRYSNPKCDRE